MRGVLAQVPITSSQAWDLSKVPYLCRMSTPHLKVIYEINYRLKAM